MAETPAELHAEIEHLERKHAENPEGRFFVPLANAYRKLGELDRAETLLRKGIERHSDYLSARIVLARCLADRGDGDGATAEFERVLELDPQNLIALRTLGELALAAGRPDDAERWYRDLLSVDPMNDEARRALDEIEEAGGAPAAEQEPGSWWKPGDRDGPDLDIGEILGELEAAEAAPAETVTGDAPQEELMDWEEPEHVRSVEVVTETIAELYARQELYDRAADVYRELIRRRGGDASLAARLAEVEALARGEAPPPAVPVTESPPATEPDLAVEPDFTPREIADTEPAAPTPAAAPDPIDSWDLPDDRPRYTLDLEPTEEPEFGDAPAPESDPFAASFDIGFAAAPSGPEQEVSSRPDREDLALAEFEFAMGASDSDTDTDETDRPAEELGIVPDESFLWSAPTGEESADEADEVRVGAENTIARYLRGLAEWRAGDADPVSASLPPADTPDHAADEDDPVIELGDYFSDSSAPPVTGTGNKSPETPSSEPSSEDDDDDLESFQAWLRSLKR